ncbi:MAG: ABC-2 transporter permease [Ruminococcus sp.]|nr:ABC-2 transporter permease [Ruminococcus sp.]
MKGLIFKEIYLTRKKIYISLGIYFFLMLICVLVKLSAVHGNLRLLSEEAVKNTTNITFYLAIFGTMLALSGFVADNINSDIVSRWSDFQRSTPMSEKQVVSAAYISTGIMLLSMLVVHILMTLMLCAVFGETFHAYFVLVFIAFAFLTFIMYIFRLFCFYRFRQQKKAQFVFTATFFCLYLVFCFVLFGRVFIYQDRAKAEYEAFSEKMGVPADNFDLNSMDLTKYVKEDFIAVKDFLISYWWIFAILLITLAVVLYFVSVNALKRPFDLAGQTIEEKKEKKSFFGSLSKPKKAAKGDEN